MEERDDSMNLGELHHQRSVEVVGDEGAERHFGPWVAVPETKRSREDESTRSNGRRVRPA